MPSYESIPRKAIVCAARHYIAAHDSACDGKPVDFGSVCVNCEMWAECQGDWLKAAAPLFDAAGVRPEVIRSLASRKETSPAAATAEESSFDQDVKSVAQAICGKQQAFLSRLETQLTGSEEP